MNRRLDDFLRKQVRSAPTRTVIIDGAVSLDFKTLDRMVNALAAWLIDHGVGRGDVVSFMLPNWWEAIVAQYAILRVGGVINPLHMIYRQAELAFVFDQCQPKVVIGLGQFRSTDYGKVLREACDVAASRPRLLTVRAEDDELNGILRGSAHQSATVNASADDIALLLYTSGTTASPKGVLHSHNTLMRATKDLRDLFDFTTDDRLFMPTPITHVSGLLYSMSMPALVGCCVVFQDVWEPDQAMEIVLEHGCTFTGGATPFIKGLVASAIARGIGPHDNPLLRGSCGGADVPAKVIEDAESVLGAQISRVYGLSEGITVTGSRSHDDIERRATTDGPVLPGFDVRIVTPHGLDAGPDEEGEIWVRGPATCLGYLDASANDGAFAVGSYFRTGDLVRRDASGYVSVSGRLKDIIIRGGENISAREVEELLMSHPQIDEVAVVGIPDERLGERVCAFVVTRSDETLELSDVTDFLRAKKIAPQKLPERLELIDELPRTPTGKVQKFALRERVLPGE
ncbi:AMP-binding protein [Gemmatimonas sp.]|uniref:AMP-binding protein n=1 Tax=Gemmatimonas sp. TaxID=1962908 RepID=UPI003563028C